MILASSASGILFFHLLVIHQQTFGYQIEYNKMAPGAAFPSIKQVWKQAVFLCAVAMTSAYFVKQNVTIRRRKQFVKEASSYDSLMQDRVRERSGESISTVKPGFPLEDGVDRYERKSEYEGAGLSYRSRRTGDKFTISHFFTDYSKEDPSKKN